MKITVYNQARSGSCLRVRLNFSVCPPTFQARAVVFYLMEILCFHYKSLQFYIRI